MLSARSGHAAFRGEVAESVGEDGHFDVEFGAIGVGAALGGREFAFVSFGFDGCGSSGAVEEAFDVSSLHDVEAHECGFLDEAGEDAVLVAGIGGDGDASLLSFLVEEGAEGEVDLGIHEHDVGFVFKGGEAVVGGRPDAVGAFDENIDGMVFEEGERIVMDFRMTRKIRCRFGGLEVVVGNPTD